MSDMDGRKAAEIVSTPPSIYGVQRFAWPPIAWTCVVAGLTLTGVLLIAQALDVGDYHLALRNAHPLTVGLCGVLLTVGGALVYAAWLPVTASTRWMVERVGLILLAGGSVCVSVLSGITEPTGLTHSIMPAATAVGALARERAIARFSRAIRFRIEE